MRDPGLDYRQVFAALPGPATLVDANGMVLADNPAVSSWAPQHGVLASPEERIGRPVWECAGAGGPALRELVRQVVDRGETVITRDLLVGASGQAAHVERRGLPLRDAVGGVAGVLLLQEDITDRIRQEERRLAVAQVRERVWRMQAQQDLPEVLVAVRDRLHQLGLPLRDCGVNLVDLSVEPPAVFSHTMNLEGRWYRPGPGHPGSELVLRFWRERKIAYRRDLATEDAYGENAWMNLPQGLYARAVVDVPFSHGTLAVNSPDPEAFTPEHLEILQELAQVLSEGFTRAADFRALEQRNRELEGQVAERARVQEALQASEERFRSLVEDLPVAVIHNTVEGRILYHNAYAQRMMGYRTEELPQVRAEELYVHPEDRQDLLRNLREKGEHSYEYALRRKDGRVVWVRGVTRVMRDAAGQVAYLQGIAQDATALRRRETRRRVREQVRSEIWGMRSSGDIRKVLTAVWNGLRALELGFDYCGANVVDETTEPSSVTVYNITPAGDWQQYRFDGRREIAIWRILQEQGAVYRRDLEAEDRFGEAALRRLGIRSVVDVPFSRGTLALSSRAPSAFTEDNLAVLTDMAAVLSEGFGRFEDLRRLEERVQEAETLAAAIALTSTTQDPEQVFEAVVRGASRLMAAERATLFLYDEERSELVPRAQVGHVWEHYRHIRLKPGEDLSGRAFSSGETCVLTVAVGPKGQIPTEAQYREEATGTDGTAAAVPLRLEGRPIGALAVGSSHRRFEVRDAELLARLGEQAVLAIDRAQRAHALEQRNRDLEEQIVRRQQAEEQLLQAQKMELMGQLTAGIAHNFNNLLQVVIGNLQMARAESDRGRLAGFLEECSHASDHAAEIVRQLMLFARKSGESAHEPTDLAVAVGHVVDICRRTFDPRFQLRVELPEELPLVQGNLVQLEQVVMNLCMNARDALDEGGRRPACIALTAGVVDSGVDGFAVPAGVASGRFVRLRVTDNGAGMEEAVRRRVFEPFFTTKPAGRGTGLGLSMAYAVVHSHGGWVECASQPGVGTTFSVHLPAAGADRSSGVRAAPAVQEARGQGTVLLIEDEEAVRRVERRILERAGYEVLQATDGLEGLQVFAAEQDRIGAVLLDLSMPGLSGAEVLAQLRTADPRVKVALVSGYAITAEQYPGVSEILRKPATIPELLGVVRRLLAD